MALSKKIEASLIFEIIGRPPKNLVDTLESIIKQIDNEKGIEVTSKNIKEPVLMKDQKDFYTTFAEVDVEVEEPILLAILMFKYMPAHIDVFSPELISISNHQWGDILSELTRRLHAYDEVARVLRIQNAQLQQKVDSLTKSQVSPSEEHKTKELMPKEKEAEKKEELKEELSKNKKEEKK